MELNEKTKKSIEKIVGLPFEKILKIFFKLWRQPPLIKKQHKIRAKTVASGATMCYNF